jgi:molybdenum cofactor biosynthesis protein B
MTSSSREHQRHAADHDPVRCAVLTVSDTRTPKTDRSGPLAEQLLAEHGHVTVARAIVRDEPDTIAAQLETWLADQQVQVILTTGGTGIARRDTTIEVVRKLVAVELDGFGELFRMLSYRDIAAAAMLSRAVAGLVCREPQCGGDTFLFAIPGSTDAVRTATAELIAPQLAHLVWHRR